MPAMNWISLFNMQNKSIISLAQVKEVGKQMFYLLLVNVLWPCRIAIAVTKMLSFAIILQSFFQLNFVVCIMSDFERTENNKPQKLDG